jgi:hypothetical protein
MNGTDPRKSLQRNIRVDNMLWDFVKSLATEEANKRRSVIIDCSKVIRTLIKKEMVRHARKLGRIQRANMRQNQAHEQTTTNTVTSQDGSTPS